MYGPVAEAAASVQGEMLTITPYMVPARSELKLLQEQRGRNARVAILTNSLESAPEKSAHAGYMHYRPQLLEEGVELYEVRAWRTRREVASPSASQLSATTRCTPN
jgi:putative cardiolipin synthase